MKKKHALAATRLLIKITILPFLLLTFSFMTVFAKDADGQGVLNEKFTLTFQETELQQVIEAVEKQANIRFVYSPSVVNDVKKVTYQCSNKSLKQIFEDFLSRYGIQYQLINEKKILLFVAKDETTIRSLVNASAEIPPAVISGTVKDDKGNPLEGVSVKAIGTNASTVTDKNGRYSIRLNDTKLTLQFSFIGFTTVERTIPGSVRTIDVVMKEDAADLKDVIVVGYGTVRKKDLTGSVGKANVEDMQKAPVFSFDQALAGRIAGVNVVSNDGQPGEAATISVRGTSISQDASPLFVVDGFPIENLDINSINPNDIESLEVLKDASSIAIYGSRGANGVIIITTRRGVIGKPKVTYNVSYGIQKDLKRMQMLSPYEFVKLQLELDSIQSTASTPVTRYRNLYLGNKYTLESYRNIQGLDWQDLVLRTGAISTNSLSINGGAGDTRYAFTGSYFNQKGIIINTGLQRIDGKFTFDQKLNKNIKIGLSASYSNTRSFGTLPKEGSRGGVVQAMWQYRPVVGVGSQDLISSLIDSTALTDFDNGGTQATIGDNLVNPLVQAQNEYRRTINNTALINGFIEYSFFKNFKLRLSGGYNSTNLRSEAFYNSKTSQGLLLVNAFGSVANNNGINGNSSNTLNGTYLSENVLSYAKKINSKHSIDAIAGFTYQYSSTKGLGLRVIQIPQSVEYLGINSLFAGIAGQPTISVSQWQLYSFLGRVNYNIANKYLFTATGRSDGSSKFAPGKQWGYFPSGAFAWRFTQEPFLKKILPIVNDGKLRVSYGSVGNNKVGDYSYLSQNGNLAQSFGYPLNNVLAAGVVPFFYGNNALVWETTKEFDLGLNLGFLKDRITIETDYYVRKTTDFLVSVTVPYSSGYNNGANSQYQNVGAISNRGFEFTINTINTSKTNRKFSWTSSFNISINRSKVDALNAGADERQTQMVLGGDNANTNNANGWTAKVGQQISQFFGYEWGGVYQFSDFDKLANGTYLLKNGLPTYSANVQPGDPKYIDINGDGKVDANDRTTIGSPLPKHTGGFSNNFTYKNFSLNVFLQWSYGGQIFNGNRIAFESTGGYFINGNQFASYANRWTPDNPTNDISRARFALKGDAGSAVARISSRVVEDGSFIRLKTVSLGYSLPANVLKKIRIQSIRTYLAAQNLLTLTKYSGLDPEVSTYRSPNNATGGPGTGGTGYVVIQPSAGYSALAGGYDYTPYPRAFTLTLGLSVTF